MLRLVAHGRELLLSGFLETVPGRSRLGFGQKHAIADVLEVDGVR